MVSDGAVARGGRWYSGAGRMSEPEVYHALLMLLFGLSGVVFAVLGLMSAPYGRHRRRGFGPGIPERLAWVAMEAPAALLFAWVFFRGSGAGNPAALLMLVLWEAHYLHRAFIYPFRRSARRGARMPVVLVVAALVVNVVVSYLNARWLTHLGPEYGWRWMLSVRFIYGLQLFVAGFAINRWADHRLRALRRPGRTDYTIPRGGLFDSISCPNYLGEVVQWLGWAILTWSPAGLAFAVFTAANLVPRAVSHHRWYQRTFREYPRHRRAIIPYVL